MNVQIVDDDRDFAESMGDLVAIRGHNVFIANNGEQAIQQSREEKIDITFMDVKMPQMNGVETFREMRAINPAVHVIMMTAYSVDALINEALDNGALGIVNKPLEMDNIHTFLANMSESLFVLVVDDDSDFAQSTSELLRKNSYIVGSYTSPEDAVEHILSNGVNVLLLDLKLGENSGIDILKNLSSQGISIPTVLITGNEDEKKRAERLKFDSLKGMLSKPFEPEELISMLDNLREQKRAGH